MYTTYPGFALGSSGRARPKIEVFLSEEVREPSCTVWCLSFTQICGHATQVNNTLNNDCPNAADGTAQMDIWLHHFAPPIAKRLNKAARGANLTDEDVFGLMAMCPFESIARARVTAYTQEEEGEDDFTKKKARSPFCDLFTEEEWLAFEFRGDVEKYYKTGYVFLLVFIPFRSLIGSCRTVAETPSAPSKA